MAINKTGGIEEYEKWAVSDFRNRQIVFNQIMAYATCVIAYIGILQLIVPYINNQMAIIFLTIPLMILIAFIIMVMFGSKSYLRS